MHYFQNFASIIFSPMTPLIHVMFSCVFIEEAMIIYVSRGLLSSLTEAREVMDMIAYHNGRLNHRVIINTYAVIDSKFKLLVLIIPSEYVC